MTPEATAAPAESAAEPEPLESSILAYRAKADAQARNYDRSQDISPRQMLILLDVAERTGTSLGQALATGEMESAHTWNDYVRPTLRSGKLGAASGVWQFMPGTFHRIIRRFGAQLLAAAEADPSTGRKPMDLGSGPFGDARVRELIQETVDGKRGVEDVEVQLLRHNFAVLAFAKHYLSKESGATTPEEDYLFHFLGESEGRRVLALARGPARNTLCVKPVEKPVPLEDVEPALADADGADAETRLPALEASLGGPAPTLIPAIEGRPSVRISQREPGAERPRQAPVERPLAGRGLGSASQTASGAGYGLVSGIGAGSGLVSRYGPPRYLPQENRALSPAVQAALARQDSALGRADGASGDVRVLEPAPAVAADPAIWTPKPRPVPKAPPPPSSQWGFPADSATVTGNVGMFYRDGRGQSQPYTWGQFLDHLGRRVKAKEQPTFVRAKYAVGLPLKGGDMPQWAFDPEKPAKATAFPHEISGEVLLPQAMVTGPLDAAEARRYRERLASLVAAGEDKPLAELPPTALAALRHLGLLPPSVRETSTEHPQVSKALSAFRKLVGKDEPDDPAGRARLMPAERVALELYEQRLARFAALQATQKASLAESVDLTKIKTLPSGLRSNAAPRVVLVQRRLAETGLLKQPMEKVVWRDKKRRKHVTYKEVPFVGTVGKATVAALNGYQWRNGLRKTEGVVDSVTLGLLGLPPMGPEIFLPLRGPQSPYEPQSEPMTARLAASRPSPSTLGGLLIAPPRPVPVAFLTAPRVVTEPDPVSDPSPSPSPSPSQKPLPAAPNPAG